MVHSASVEENMGKHQQPVPVEEIIPADTETEIQRSVPLPPPINPETEDFSPSSVSDTSSGYMSTSISTATLSDIYTLSWDLPAPSSSRGGPFESVPDEEEEEKTGTKELYLDQSEPQETMLNLNKEAVERRDQKPNDTQSHLETNRSSSVQLKEEEEPDPGLGDQTKENQNSTTGNAGSEALNNSETHTDSVVEKNTESRQESSTEDQQVDNRTRKECEPPLHNETQHSDQVGDSQLDLDVPKQPEQDHTGSDNTQDPAPEPNGDSALQISPNKPLISETSDPISTSVLPPSSITHETQQVTPSDSSTTAPPPLKVQPPKSGSSAANPFKIQKVKSSDLKSFQRMVGEEGGKPAMVDRASSLGAGLNLSVPMESLEIISDSEEGDEAASAVLPDWLKEGEFVTVGTNKSGTVRYVGPTDFAAGTWVGVELEVPAGKNDGSVGGKHYFHCNPGYGVLVRPDRVAHGGTKRRRQQQKRQSANLSGSSPNLAALTALAKGETGPAGRNKGENRKSWNT